MNDLPDHYAALGLDARCTAAQIRAAYRLLAKRVHPDLNGHSEAATERARMLNAAHELLSDPARRAAYDRDRAAGNPPRREVPAARIRRDISQDVFLGMEDFFCGVRLTVQVRDPAHPGGPETYVVEVPADTAPGARLKVPRGEPFAGGFVTVRLKARPGARFKARGSDVRCDLRISAQRATQGGSEMVPAPSGRMVRVAIPAGVGRGAVLRVAGEGLPKSRGGRGDLLVRITYRPEVRVARGRSSPGWW